MKNDKLDKMPPKSDDNSDRKRDVDESKMTLKTILLFTLPVIIAFLTFCYFFIGSLEK